jgi:hypothetical protein
MEGAPWATLGISQHTGHTCGGADPLCHLVWERCCVSLPWSCPSSPPWCICGRWGQDRSVPRRISSPPCPSPTVLKRLLFWPPLRVRHSRCRTMPYCALSVRACPVCGIGCCRRSMWQLLLQQATGRRLRPYHSPPCIFCIGIRLAPLPSCPRFFILVHPRDCSTHRARWCSPRVARVHRQCCTDKTRRGYVFLCP